MACLDQHKEITAKRLLQDFDYELTTEMKWISVQNSK